MKVRILRSTEHALLSPGDIVEIQTYLPNFDGYCVRTKYGEDVFIARENVTEDLQQQLI